VTNYEYKRLERVEKPGGTRFITCSCNHRLPFFKSDRIKQVFAETLDQACERHRARLIAWVLMPEHFHLLVLPDLPESPMRVLLSAVKSPVGKAVINRWRQLKARILARITDPSGDPHFWLPGGGYDRNIWSREEFHEKLKYIHQNPVRRGLASTPEEWPWSSARWYKGDRTRPVRVWDQWGW
jgi:putative transposase